MAKIAIILYGAPGSGKGTQANLISQKLGLIHFDTGRFLEGIVHDPKRQKEKMVRRERKLFDAGILMTPSFVLREMAREARAIAKARWGLIFSGSPRTIYEAKGLIPLLEKLYSKRNIFVFHLNVSPKESLERNSRRLLCSVCHAPLLTIYYSPKTSKHCGICGGPLYRRTIDKPEVIKVRLKQYEERTKPIFDFMQVRGYNISKINGAAPPYLVFKHIYKYLKRAKLE